MNATECVNNKDQAGKAGRRKNNQYTYVGSPVSAIDPEQHADFIFNYQQSILLALVKRNLLTSAQCEQCIEELRLKRVLTTRERGCQYEEVRKAE